MLSIGTMKPQHTHDCTQCHWLGSLGTLDLYLCEGDDGNGSAIIRFGSDGPEYSSRPLFNLARERAAVSSSLPTLVIDRMLVIQNNTSALCNAVTGGEDQP